MRFQHAMILFSSLQDQITEWEKTLSRDGVKENLRKAFQNLTREDFEMVECLILMFMTEPGRRLLGEEMDIMDRDLTVEDVAQRAAERMGILKPTKKSGGGDREYLRRKRTGDRKRR